MARHFATIQNEIANYAMPLSSDVSPTNGQLN
jgi:hypothetical protein